ncbi:Crp/Fnr family transcriptional regulator [Erythrobacter donghaensis]|uniref:Crp/Fnr family transcriptional regulator n=1 Tax=Erythrobacter donghaensis TaxID=267135 RepID=UPI00093FB19B
MNFVSCTQCPLRKLTHFRKHSPEELAFIASLKSGQVEHDAGTIIIEPGGHANQLYTLLSGWALRYRLTTCGERQIVEVLLPGSIIGLQSVLLGLQNEGVSSLTRVSLCVLGGAAVGELFAHQPGLARGLVNSLLQDQNRADRQMTLNAKTSSASRLGHFLLEIFDRAGALGGQSQRWCHFPLQRGDLSDLLGISPTHVSRSAGELSKLGLATIRGNTLEIIDRQALVGFSGYQIKHAEVKRLLL